MTNDDLQEYGEHLSQNIRANIGSTLVEIFRATGMQVPEDVIYSTLNKTAERSSSNSQTPFSQQHQDATRHHSPGPPFTQLVEARKCILTNQVDGSELIVAKGWAYPRVEDDVVHGMPLLADHVRVSVEVIGNGMGEYTIPVPTNDLRQLSDVVGSLCQWPMSWVILDLDESRFDEANSRFLSQEPPTTSKKSSTTSQNPYRKFDISQSQLARMRPRSETMLVYLSIVEDAYIWVDFDKELFEYPSEAEHGNKYILDVQDMTDMMNLKWLGGSMIQTFEKLFYDMMRRLGMGM